MKLPSPRHWTTSKFPIPPFTSNLLAPLYQSEFLLDSLWLALVSDPLYQLLSFIIIDEFRLLTFKVISKVAGLMSTAFVTVLYLLSLFFVTIFVFYFSCLLCVCLCVCVCFE